MNRVRPSLEELWRGSAGSELLSTWKEKGNAQRSQRCPMDMVPQPQIISFVPLLLLISQEGNNLGVKHNTQRAPGLPGKAGSKGCQNLLMCILTGK